MPLFEANACPEVFFRAEDAWGLLRMKGELFQVFDALVAVLSGADETQWCAVTTVERLPIESGRKQHVGAEQVLQQEDCGVPVRAFSGDERRRRALPEKRADEVVPDVTHADALPVKTLSGPRVTQ